MFPTKIIFIHGLSENSYCWNNWVKFFERLNYECLAPDYPYHVGLPEILRKNPDPRLKQLDLTDVIEYYAQYYDSLKSDDIILVRHSMGGLIVQKLVASDRGLLGVLITSAAPKGIIEFSWNFAVCNIPTINPAKGNSLFLGSKFWFHYSISNSLSRPASDFQYDKYIVVIFSQTDPICSV